MKSNTNERKQDALELKHKKAARQATRLCYYPQCTNKAIKSHILQENGILNQIADNGKFIEYAPETPFRQDGFYPAGVNASNMFTFNGFCSEHDNSIFKEIENGKTDFLKQHEQLLFAYRGLVNDLFKAEVVTDYFNKVFLDKNISDKRKEFYKVTRARRLFSKKDLQHYKMLIEKELWNGIATSNFTFYRFELPRIEIATSTIYGGAFYRTLDYNKISKLNPLSNEYIPVSKPIFINLIPRDNSLLMVLGHVISLTSIESIPVSKIPYLQQNEVLKLLSKILAKTETWGMSKALYDKWKLQGKIKKYFDFRHKWLAGSIQIIPPSGFINFNIFSNPNDFNLFRDI